ncbi:unnamed protein product [Hermetia illucens]|uniref:Uncharacterized protein n=1 Tax=Hermetia illucens TaxID=343691 RepID=A0A7R8UCI1_HERIL|nr:uncharacterized protein LOC119646953 [Hermetia illucens]CAD7078268.1 unnamed protein product [Hermetia illucens]
MEPFKKCCFCCKLETGAYILGAAGLILSLVNIIGGSLILNKIIITDDESPPSTIFHIIYSVVGLICFALLIFGAKRRNSWLMLPYIVYSVVSLATVAVVLFIEEFNGIHETYVKVGLVLVFGVAICLEVYFVLCMISLYLKLRKEKCENENEGFFKL